MPSDRSAWLRARKIVVGERALQTMPIRQDEAIAKRSMRAFHSSYTSHTNTCSTNIYRLALPVVNTGVVG